MKKIVLTAILVLVTGICAAQPKRSYLKGGQIVIQDKENKEDVKVLDYAQDMKYHAPYHLKNWKVFEKLDPAKEALAVFKKKSRRPYAKRAWIVDRNDDTRKIVVEYASPRPDEHIVFSPDEDFAFYLNLSSDGTSIVTGLNLLTSQEFTIAQAESFTLTNCPDKKTYLVVKYEDGAVQGTKYVAYTESGQEVRTFYYDGSSDTIDMVICY